MEVDGISVAAAEDLQGQLLANIEINESGHLVFTRFNGEVIDVGLVKRPPIDSWPVGSIYFTINAANPAAVMGGGTWTVWGAGRVPVGVSSGETEFNTVEKTGGAKTHTLTVAEMPSHNHGGSTSSDGAHTHTYNRPLQTLTDTNGSQLGTKGTDLQQTLSAGAHTHTITAQGGGAAHNNLQPYITCYMWKRTA